VREIEDDFYPRLFKNNPETKAFFNPANQFQDPPHQRMALANAIVAVATNINDLAPLTDAVELIANKHAGLSVQKPHYGIVHKNLMESIAHVLGDIVTPEIGEGWSEAVLAVAGILSNREAELYTMAAERSGGWTGIKDFRIESIREVSTDCREFTFVKADGDESPIEFTAGMFLTMHLKQDGMTPRHYSITNVPGKKYLQCCVKKLDRGAVSGALHSMSVGDVVGLAPPFGTFGYKSGTGMAVLISAGIGATPMKSMLEASPDRVQMIVHVDKSEAAHPFRTEMMNAGKETHFHYTSQKGRPDFSELVSSVLKPHLETCDFFLCGPPAFLSSMKTVLTSANAKSVTVDVFGPALA